MNYPALPSSTYNNQVSLQLSEVLLIVFVAATFTYTAFSIHGGLFADEFAHAPQIWTFYSNSSHFDEKITVLPTYHYIMALAVKQIGFYHDNLLKLITLLISLATIPVFYSLFKKYHDVQAGARTLQLFFLPNLFVYYFLIYTDIWALLLIAINLLLALHRHYLLSAAIGLLAICLRQDSIIWISLSFLLICFEQSSHQQSLRARSVITNAITKGSPYLVIFFAFLVFTFINDGVAIGDKERHNSGLINITNLYLFLLLGWLLFLPLNIKLLPIIAKTLKKPWIAAAAIAGFFVYITTLTNTHEYNIERLDYFLHNKIAELLATNTLARGLSYPLALWMLLTLVVMPTPEARFKWILLVIPLAVIFHPMIEPRYYIPAFLLIQLTRPSMPSIYENGSIVYYILLSGYLTHGIISGTFFP